MTPCDLFKLIKGRTLWIIGDSMSKDLVKVGGLVTRLCFGGAGQGPAASAV